MALVILQKQVVYGSACLGQWLGSFASTVDGLVYVPQVAINFLKESLS